VRDVLNIDERRYDWGMVASNTLRHGDPTFPRRICIALSKWCNRRCPYCPVGVFGASKVMVSDEVFDAFVTRLAEIKWNGWASIGGYSEPTAVNHLADYVRKLKAGCPTCLPVVYSNGDYLTPDVVLSLRNAGLHHLIVTRHKPYSLSWDTRMESCLSVADSQITVRNLKDSDLVNQGGLTDVPYAPFKRCALPSNSLEFTTEGIALMCCADYKVEQPKGNLMENSIRQIWYDRSYFRQRLKLLAGLPETPLCKRCMAGKVAA